MEPEQPQNHRKTIRNLRIGIVSAAVALGLVAFFEINRQPRTDDAEVTANFIGIAPQVEGPIIRLNVNDNQFVKQGELLFEIDDRPYQIRSTERKRRKPLRPKPSSKRPHNCCFRRQG